MLKIDTKNTTLTVFDPYGNNSDDKRVVKVFKQFLKKCESESSFEKLRDMNWKIKKNIDYPVQRKNDTYSCGPLVTYYADCIGSGKKFDINLDIEKYREYIIKTLLQKSKNVMNVCLYCAKQVSNTVFHSCNICLRKVHDKCANPSVTDDNVTDEQITNAKDSVIVPNQFECNLCKNNIYKTEL